MKTDINLLRNELSGSGSFSPGQKLASLYVLAGILILEVLVYAGLSWYSHSLSKQMLVADSQAASVDMEIGKTSTGLKEAIRYQQRLANAGLLVNDHIFWSPVFEEISKYTYRNISYDRLTGDVAEHKVDLSGTATSFSDIGKLILGLKTSDKIKDISYQSSGASRSEKSGFGFNVELMLDPKLFKK